MRLLAGAVLAVLLMLATVPAAAKSPVRPGCGQRDRLVAWLANRFSESLRFHATDRRGNRIEFLASARGTWTLLVVRPNGHACVAAAGVRWRRNRGI